MLYAKWKINTLINNQLTKSTMKLVDEIEFQKLLSTLKIEETISGGSVANSIVGLSQLGNDVGFIGKVNDDNLGKKYEEGLTKEKVQYFYNKKKEIFTNWNLFNFNHTRCRKNYGHIFRNCWKN